MSENINNSPDNNFEKIHLLLYEKIDKEMEAFKASYKNFDVQQTYNDWYRIGFYESYYEMMSCDFLDNQNAEEAILWLSGKDEPLAFLYNEWMDSDGAFSHDWDNMFDFIRTIYEEEYLKESRNKETDNLAEFGSIGKTENGDAKDVCIKVLFDGIHMDNVFVSEDNVDATISSIAKHSYENYNGDVKEAWEKSDSYNPNPKLTFVVIKKLEKGINSIDKSIGAAKERCSGSEIANVNKNVDFDIDRG